MQTASSEYHQDSEYHRFLTAFREGFNALAATAVALFTTDVCGVHLWKMYLDALPPHERQHHTCHACRRFVEAYGGLVTINESGRTTPVMWSAAAGETHGPAFSYLHRHVSQAKVTGVFLSDQKTWGQPTTGKWHHMAVTTPTHLVYKPKHSLDTPSAKMAEKLEDYRMLSRGLGEFAEQIPQVYHLVSSGDLYRNEKVISVAKWLNDLHDMRRHNHQTFEKNLTWRAVATAPPGFCHVRSTMIGTLLEDLQSGMSYDTVKRRFEQKMSPLQYQRPTAAPSEGNIKQAERLVADLGIQNSLKRRFALLEEIMAIWRSHPDEAPQPNGVFGHLRPQVKRQDMTVKGGVMTWVKFARDVLPNAKKIECLVPVSGSFLAIIGPEDPESPALFQWDNRYNWYVYPGGSPASAWNLRAGAYVKVNAMTHLPFKWNGHESPQHGDGVVAILDGCRDTRHTTGAALFPQTLKSEYRSIRTTIEAYSNRATISARDQATACGLDLRKGGKWNVTFRVTTSTGVTEYNLDRWE